MDNETSKTNNLNNEFIAHVRKFDGLKQPLHVHLAEVAQISKKLAEKINAPLAGELIGLIHDFGKYSQAFQIYIKSATGLLNPDIDDEYVDAKGLKGRIDHSTAGAQWIYHQLKNYGKRGEGQLIAQILALCVASHHSGLINCLDDHATKPNAFLRRINDKLEEMYVKKGDKVVLNNHSSINEIVCKINRDGFLYKKTFLFVRRKVFMLLIFYFVCNTTILTSEF